MNEATNINSHSSVKFLRLVVEGNIDEAYQQYVDMRGKHHHPHFPAGFSALQNAMKENHLLFPIKKFDIHHVLCDGEYVAVHSRISTNPDESGYAVVHLFRFQENKITELWDVVQELPEKSPNVDGMF
jgi:predicted SnoaL-like aldol condensation-catalyzing enzyme